MCQKPECPHKGDKMCSCAGLNFSSGNELRTHFLKNLTGMKLELFYNTLAAPAPYRLCMVGSCASCGGRLCMSDGIPSHLRGEGFLAVILDHALKLELKCADQFVELFHEKDRPIVRRWLKSLEDSDGSPALPGHEVPDVIYTIVQTSADHDRGLFPDPMAWGSYLSISQARKRLRELIAEKKKTLSSRCDTENFSEDFWEAFEADYAAARFVRIEILASELSCGEEGGAL